MKTLLTILLGFGLVAAGEARAVPLSLTSAAFGNGAAIPQSYTCEGQNLSPPLRWNGSPSGTKSFALIVEDPDAPGGTFAHWLLYNIPVDVTSLAPGAVPRGAQEGENGFGRIGYGGPCPPSGQHRYFFKLFALDANLSVHAPNRMTLETAMRGHVLASAQLLGTYQKKKR